jgi:hypothetical protein
MEVPHLPSDVLARAGLELALSEAVSVGEVTGKASPAEPFAKVTSLARSHARTRSISWPVSGQAEQVGDRLTLDRAVAEWHIACELVTVVRSDPRPSDITGVHQVRYADLRVMPAASAISATRRSGFSPTASMT